MAVGELARHFPVSRPAISQHLRILKDAHLVLDQAKGTQRIYALNPDGFESLRDHFDRVWTHALSAFAKKVEELESAEQPPKEQERDNDD